MVLYFMISHAFHAFWILFKSNIMENTVLPMLSMLSMLSFCKFPCFPCFPWFSMVFYSMLSMLSWGVILQFLLSHASMESMGISPWKPWNFALAPCSMVFKGSMEFSPCFFHGFSTVFPCFQYQGIQNQHLCLNWITDQVFQSQLLYLWDRKSFSVCNRHNKLIQTLSIVKVN